jgi:peptide/nickel transport system substrate-binding protein
LINRALFRNYGTIANDQPIPPNHPYFRDDLLRPASIWTGPNGMSSARA